MSLREIFACELYTGHGRGSDGGVSAEWVNLPEAEKDLWITSADHVEYLIENEVHDRANDETAELEDMLEELRNEAAEVVQKTRAFFEAAKLTRTKGLGPAAFKALQDEVLGQLAGLEKLITKP